MLEKENVYNLRNRNVKRMLWPVDHDQLKRDLRKEQERIGKELTQKYNFDFSSSQPLRGKYDWVHVGPESPLSSPCLIEEKDPCSSSTNACVSDEKPTHKLRKKTSNKLKIRESVKNVKVNQAVSSPPCKRRSERKKTCRKRK